MTIQYCSDFHLEFPENKEYILNNLIIPKASATDFTPIRHLKTKITPNKPIFSLASDNK